MAAAKKKKSMKTGGGGRFAALEKKVEGEGKDPKAAKAIAAAAGRKKFGAKKMAEFAAKGKAKSSKRPRNKGRS